MQKYFRKVSPIILLFALVFTFNTQAQQEATEFSPFRKNSVVLANVEIYNTNNKKIDDNTYSISFSLFNDVGIQSNIRYGIQLVDADNRPIDMHLANEAITIGEKESVDLSINYTIPSYVENGTYRLMVVAQNQNGLPLAFLPAGFPEPIINIQGRTIYPQIENCYLVVDGEDFETQRYTLNQGVDVVSDENLRAICSINNKGQRSQDLRIQLITHKRSQFGDILHTKIIENTFSIKPNSEEQISFSLPKMSVPQAYNVDAFLVNKNGEKISKSVFFHYVIVGSSATLQNTILDKSSYLESEKANLKVIWTAGADTFEESRLGGTYENYLLTAEIKDGLGQVCGATEKNISSTAEVNTENLLVGINKSCQEAVALVQIKNHSGEILDSVSIDTNSPSESININLNISKGELFSGFSNRVAIFLILALMLIILTFLFLLKKRKGVKKY